MTTHARILLAAALAFAVPPIAHAADVDEQVESLQREITALRVVHALDLSDDQIQTLIPLVDEGIGLVDDLRSVHAQCQRDSLPVLRRLRDDLADDGEISPDTEETSRVAIEESERTTRIVMQELKDLAEEVLHTLDEDQRTRVHHAVSEIPGSRRQHRNAQDESGQDSTPDAARLEMLPPELRQEIRNHNTRRLFGLVFSEEFLSVLEEH